MNKIFKSNLSLNSSWNKLNALFDNLKNSVQYDYFAEITNRLIRLDTNHLLELLNCCQSLTKASFSYDFLQKTLIIHFHSDALACEPRTFAKKYLEKIEGKVNLIEKDIILSHLSEEEAKGLAIYILVALENSSLEELAKEGLADYLACVQSQEGIHPFSRIAKEVPSRKLFLDIQRLSLLPSMLISQEDEQAAEEKWQNYIVRKKNWNRHYGSSSQREYGRLMHHTTCFAASRLEKGKWTFDTLLGFLANRRQYIALLLDQKDPLLVGTFRIQDEEEIAMTTCVNEYYAIPVRLKMLLSQQENPHLKREESLDSSYGNCSGKGYCYAERLNSRTIPLSQVIIYDAPISHFCMFDEQPMSGEIIHTSTEHLKEILAFIREDLYPKALTAQTADERFIHLGKIFWWICQAKPWRLGDPSIAEMLIRTILALKKEESPPWKEGLIPWIEVMCEPEAEKFAAHFHLLFEWSNSPSSLFEEKANGLLDQRLV